MTPLHCATQLLQASSSSSQFTRQNIVMKTYNAATDKQLYTRLQDLCYQTHQCSSNQHQYMVTPFYILYQSRQPMFGIIIIVKTMLYWEKTPCICNPHCCCTLSISDNFNNYKLHHFCQANQSNQDEAYNICTRTPNSFTGCNRTGVERYSENLLPVMHQIFISALSRNLVPDSH